MSREPIDKLARKRKPQGRAGLWAEIRAQRHFTRRALREATDISQDTVIRYLDALEKAGIVARDGKDGEAIVFKLVRDTGIEAPRVRRDGSLVTQGDVNERLWRTMKLMKAFTVAELAATAAVPGHPVPISTAQRYAKHLADAGYLTVLPGTKPPKFRFCRDTGPKPPMVQRTHRIFDPNLGRVVHQEDQG